MNEPEARWYCSAVLTQDDERTGYKRGKKFDPKGFYYNGRQIILVGSVKDDNVVRLSFPVERISIRVRFLTKPPSVTPKLF